MPLGAKSQTTIIPLLARRFLVSTSSDGFLSFISWVSMAGVALGVLAVTTTTSVLNGFEGELSRVITSLNGEVILYTRGNPISHPRELQKKILEIVPSTRHVTASLVTELMVSGTKGDAGGAIEGIDPQTVGAVTEIPKRVTLGRMPYQGAEIALGYALADRVGAKVGDSVRLVAPFVGEGSEARIFKVTVVGIVKMGMYRYDSTFIFTPIETLQTFLQQPDRVTTFKLKLKPGADLEKAAAALRDNFGYPFRAKYWAQLDNNLLVSIALEKAVIAIVLAAILVVAAFNIVSTLMMMIYDKTKEIAILKAMGFKPAQNFKLFCGIGMFMGMGGAAIGAVLGLSLNRLIANTRLIELPADIYHIDFLPVVERWQEIAAVVGFVLIICFVATLYPSYKVMKKSPLDGLRYE